MFRVGIGQDSHRFVFFKEAILTLGGLKLKGYGCKFEGNSDGDVVLHALCNAIEQAIGGDSLSVYADKMCEKGIVDSQEYVKVALSNMRKKSYKLNNVGISIEGKHPKILPIADEMRNFLVSLLDLEKENIGINATSGEGMTAFGRGEGVQVFVIVSLIKNI